MGSGRRAASMEGAEATHGASLERAEGTPLLQEKKPGKQHDGAAGLLAHDGDGQWRSQPRSSDWRAPAIVLGFKCLEGVAYFGVHANLVMYLRSIFHETNAASATKASIWTGTTFFTPLLGAIVADTCLGCYLTVLIYSLAYLIGMIVVTLSAFLPSWRPPPCQGGLCPPATAAQSLVFSCGLYLVAFASGSIKSTLVPLGANQFQHENPIDRERRAMFFSSYYLCINFSNLVATTLVVWIQGNVSWAFGYGLGSLCLALSLGGFLLGTPLFRLVRPSGSPLKSVAQVFIASFRKMHLDVPTDGSTLYTVKDKNVVEGLEQLAHTESFRFLDKAAVVSDDLDESDDVYRRNKWRLCTVTQVEELKILLRLIPIWISSVIYAAAHSQINTTFIEQGNAMNTGKCDEHWLILTTKLDLKVTIEMISRKGRKNKREFWTAHGLMTGRGRRETYGTLLRLLFNCTVLR